MSRFGIGYPSCDVVDLQVSSKRWRASGFRELDNGNYKINYQTKRCILKFGL